MLIKWGEEMLTPRQKEVLNLIVRLYGQLEEPIGSKTLLKESLLKVSPATIRNDMVVLERRGLLMKAHTSSGRIPSINGYRYYINRIIDNDDEIKMNDDSFEALSKARNYNPIQLAQLSADILVSLTGYTAVVLGQNQEPHRFAEFKLVAINNSRYISILLTDYGKVESEIIDLQVTLTREDIQRITKMVNEELNGAVLEDAYQRMKLSIPLLTQKITAYQLDFSSLIEKAMHNIKGHRYYVSGKSNLFNLLDSNTSKETIKELFELVDGSRELYQLLESRHKGIEVLFGNEFLSNDLNLINLVTGSYENQNQKMIIGLLGPSTMSYERIIPMMGLMVNNLSNK